MLPSPWLDIKILKMENENILREFIQKVWNEKDFASITNYVSTEYTIHSDPSDPWEFRTLNYEEFAMRLDYFFDHFPEFNIEILKTIADGNDVAIACKIIGAKSSRMINVQKQNKAIIKNGFTVYHFIAGKICGHTQVCHSTTAIKQLGFGAIEKLKLKLADSYVPAMPDFYSKVLT